MEVEINQSMETTPVENSPEISQETPTQAPEQTPEVKTPEKPSEPEPELSLRDKLAKKAAESEKKRAEKAPKSPVEKAAEAAKKATDPTSKGGQLTPNEGQKLETEKFQPNYKVKVMDQEKDIPEFLKPLIKDAESQKQVQELVEKAYGLDFVKARFQESKEQAKTLYSENTGIKTQINELKEIYQRGDLDTWFKRLGVPEERVLQWVLDKVNYNQLPPEQKAILDARRDAEQRAWSAEKQVSSIQTQQEQLLTQQVQGALDSVLARSDVKTVADAFDARVGKPGAFREEVRTRGDYAWRTRNELVPPEKLVQELMGLVGPVAPQSAQPATPAVQANPAATPAAPAPNAAQAPASKQTPVIPNISGRSTSALKPTVKSVADLRNRYKELQSEG